MDIEIKISGSGTPRQVIHALQRLTKTIQEASNEELEGLSIEDPILYMQTKVLEDDQIN